MHENGSEKIERKREAKDPATCKKLSRGNTKNYYNSENYESHCICTDFVEYIGRNHLLKIRRNYGVLSKSRES